MADEKKMKQAKTTFGTLCEMLDEHGVHYEKDTDKLLVHFYMNGDDIPMEVFAEVDAERELVRVHSPLPFAFSEAKRLEGAIATSQANYRMADGSFDYNFRDGKVFFRLTSSYKESLLSKDLLGYMIACTVYTVDKYNDKFLMIDKGLLSLDDFLKQS